MPPWSIPYVDIHTYALNSASSRSEPSSDSRIPYQQQGQLVRHVASRVLASESCSSPTHDCVTLHGQVKLFTPQRRSPRYSCRFCIVVVDHAGNWTKGECRTLSQGGFGATISGDLLVGSIVSIVFTPSLMDHTVSLQARVLYHVQELHGFEFIAPAETQREVIAALFKEAVGDESNQP